MNTLIIEPIYMSINRVQQHNVPSSNMRTTSTENHKMASMQINRKKRTQDKIIDKSLLEQIIEDLRKRLNQLAREKGLLDHQVIHLSQELDLYIVQYQKLVQKRENDSR